MQSPTPADSTISGPQTEDFIGAVRRFQEGTRARLYDSNPSSALRLCKYGLLQNSERLKFLSQRSESYLDDILGSLPEGSLGNQRERDDGGVCLRKAKEIVRRMDEDLPALLPIDRRRFQLMFENSKTVDKITNEIKQMYYPLGRIPIREFVRYFAGAPSDIVDHVLSFISDTEQEFSSHLNRNPDARRLIEQVNNVCH